MLYLLDFYLDKHLYGSSTNLYQLKTNYYLLEPLAIIGWIISWHFTRLCVQTTVDERKSANQLRLFILLFSMVYTFQVV